jgi:hypothetical protein
MSNHQNLWFKQQPKVIAHRANPPADPTAWLAAAVAGAGILYLFSFFFSFTGGGRLPAGN